MMKKQRYKGSCMLLLPEVTTSYRQQTSVFCLHFFPASGIRLYPIRKYKTVITKRYPDRKPVYRLGIQQLRPSRRIIKSYHTYHFAFNLSFTPYVRLSCLKQVHGIISKIPAQL